MKKVIVLTLMLTAPWLSFSQNALCFDGSDDGVNCGTNSSHNVGNTSFSLEAWIYPKSFAKDVFEGSIIIQENNSNNGGFMLRAGATNQLNFAIGEGQGQDWAELTTSNILALDSWQHVAATYDGSKMRLYLDGVLVDSLSESFSVDGHGATPLTIGYHPNYSTRLWDGAIDEVRIWDKTLTQAEIQSNMNREFCDTLIDLVAYYKFDQGTAGGTNTSISAATDYSYNQINAALNNFGLTSTCSNFINGPSLSQDTTTINLSNTACNLYTDPNINQTFNADTLLDYHMPNSDGCVNRIIRNVTINYSSLSNITVTACDSFVSPSGDVYFTSGTYYDNVKNQQNCDSLITIFLTIANSPITEVSYTNCDSFYIQSMDQWVYNSGIYTDTLTNQLSCDSIVNYDIQINRPSYADTTLFFCKFVFNPTGSEVWQEEGIYYDTIANHLNCDSIITYHVISSRTYDTITISSCGEYISPFGTKTWTSSGVYNDTLPFGNQFVCDSIIQVNLTVNEPVTTQEDLSACFSTILPSGKRVTESGLYRDTLQTIHACDSIIEYDVTINTVNVDVKVEDFTLTALSTVANELQWLDCESSFSEISGATADTFQSDNHGSFAVEVTEDACVDTSECYEIYGLSIYEAEGDIKIYPNPSSGSVFITGIHQKTSFRVYNSLGKLIDKGILNSRVDLPKQNGIYFLELVSGYDIILKERIIVHR